MSNDEWSRIHPKDLWVYNKLDLSNRLGYLCGPCDIDVPRPNYYIVRPSINFGGMGRYSRIEYLSSTTDHLHPSEFWSEIFYGPHYSVDFYEKIPKLTVRGYQNPKNSKFMWNSWIKIENFIPFPQILNDLIGNYSVINCEFIGTRLIEVQFRPNLDFRWGNSIAIPVWKNKIFKNPKKLKYVSDPDYKRLGFLIK